MLTDRVIKTSITIKAPAEDILTAFLDIGWMREWWGIEGGLVEPKRDGLWTVVWGHSAEGYQAIGTGIVRRLGPYLLEIDSNLVFFPQRQILGPRRFQLQCRPEGDKTFVDIEESGFQSGGDWDWFYESVQKGWQEVLPVLKSFLERPHARATLPSAAPVSDRRVGTSIEVAASRERALEAFLNHNDLAQWWGVAKSLIDPKPQGLWALAWEPGEKGYRYVTAGVIGMFDPPERIIIDQLAYFNPEFPILAPMRLGLGFDGDDTRTQISVVQTGYGTGPDWDRYYEAVVQGWPMALARLKEFLERKS